MTALSVPIALGAAVLFGWSTAAMHHGASNAPIRHSGLRGLLALLGHVVRQWRWLTGMLASLLGVVLHAWALKKGSLAVVQPVIVSGLIFSFLFRAALDRRLPTRTTMLWSTVTAVGLAVFLCAGQQTAGSPSPDGERAAAFVTAGVLIATICWWLSTRVRASLSGILLGCGAGTIFGMTAGTLKATTNEHGVGQVLTTWPLYVLIGLGVVGFLANQTAYRKPLATALPALNLMNPLVALAYGSFAFSERLADSPATVAFGMASLGVVLLGVAMLARGERPDSEITELVLDEDEEMAIAA